MRVFPLCLTDERAECCEFCILSSCRGTQSSVLSPAPRPQPFYRHANRDLVRIGDDLDERGALKGESVLQRGSEIAAVRDADAVRAERLGEEREGNRAAGGRAHPARELAPLVHPDLAEGAV